MLTTVLSVRNTVVPRVVRQDHRPPTGRRPGLPEALAAAGGVGTQKGPPESTHRPAAELVLVRAVASGLLAIAAVQDAMLERIAVD